MKLYTKPGACSTADHIALNWTGQPFDVQIMTQSQLKEPEFLALNAAGSVPVLVDGDFVLTQNAAIMGYIADSFPEAGLAGDGGRRGRAEANRWLAYVNSDVHPAFSPLFAPLAFDPDPARTDIVKEAARTRVARTLARAETRLGESEWLAGFRSGADAYLYVTLRWALGSGIDMSNMPNLQAFMTRMEADPGVRQALESEHLKRMTNDSAR